MLACEHVHMHNMHVHIIPHTMYNYFFPGIKEATVSILKLCDYFKFALYLLISKSTLGFLIRPSRSPLNTNTKY